MTLVSLIVLLTVIGIVMYLINTYVPMESRIKSLLNIVVIIVIILWLLSALGLLTGLNQIRIGR